MNRIIRIGEVSEMTSLSKPQIYRLVADGSFPKQFSILGTRCVGWLEADIQNWINSLLPDHQEAS